MEVDMKVIDKGLKGKGHSVAFVKLVSEEGSALTMILDARSQLSAFELEEIYTVKIVQEQQKLRLEKEEIE